MKVSVGEDGGIVLEEVFNGVLFITGDGQKLGVCMRDGGFELNLIKPDGITNWVRLFDGEISDE